MRKTKLMIAAALTAAALGSFAMPGSAAAQSRPILAIGDQNHFVFGQDLFRVLNIRRSRIFLPWNTALSSRERRNFDRWLRATRAAGINDVHVSFEHTRGQTCSRRCTLPSVRQYDRAVSAFIRRYRRSVDSYEPWNEANSPTQPTGRNPRRAAEYYEVLRGRVRRACRRCEVLGADVLDITNMGRWIRTFRSTLRRNRVPTPRYWGLHNYGEVNRNDFTGVGGSNGIGIGDLMRLVPGQIWLTETGGLTRFVTEDGRESFPFDEARGGRATEYLLTEVVRRGGSRLRRIYLFHWFGTPRNRFDAGLVRENGTPRPAWEVVRNLGPFFPR